jgi:hypothetical protein
MPEIKCTVNECFFWKNDLCQAQAIEVAPMNRLRSRSLDAGTIGGSPRAAVSNSEETQCVTFRPASQFGRRVPEKSGSPGSGSPGSGRR